MSLSQWHILIVEDELDSQELVKEVLEYYGIRCTAVSTAEEALGVLEHEIPTLMIVDLNLPGMDGWGLLSRLKSSRTVSRVPRVAITAYHSAELANKAIEMGFDAYFPKPLDTTSFVRELQGIVQI
ncbi:MAG TPA: response regulator [Phototrophicaceae bacterium]|jgi:CheY-like chemotaxis protein|nr:response regulator [Phototrophicaceae bacterium]